MASRLIGRDAELAAMCVIPDRTAYGESQIVLLSGEASIGKSRLAAEIVAIAKSHGLTTLDGRAHPPGSFTSWPDQAVRVHPR